MEVGNTYYRVLYRSQYYNSEWNFTHDSWSYVDLESVTTKEEAIAYIEDFMDAWHVMEYEIHKVEVVHKKT